jgi:1-acyl-sn-glycerol-3-phosphate acyltransferase
MLYRIFRFMFRCLFYSLFRLKVSGRENIPERGTVILCANHISYFDPPLVGTPIKRMVHYMAKEELFRIPVLGWLITQFGAFPVKRGGVSREAIRHSIELLKSGKVMGIFPEGTTKNAGGMGKKGAASLAIKSNATVIPVAIIGSYKLFQQLEIIYGEPVDLSEFTEDPSAQKLEQATDKIMSTIRSMIQKNEAAK